MSNKISTKTCLNTFSGQSFYIIEVDGKSLEDIIIQNCPDITKGIVPTLLNWLSDPEERKVVWDRVTPNIGEKSKLPILMCSEDIDFSCILIMVEVETDENFIHWNKFGIEDSNALKPENIGKSIEWFTGIEKMSFNKKEYQNVLNEFRIRLDESIAYAPKDSEIIEEYKI